MIYNDAKKECSKSYEKKHTPTQTHTNIWALCTRSQFCTYSNHWNEKWNEVKTKQEMKNQEKKWQKMMRKKL